MYIDQFSNFQTIPVDGGKSRERALGSHWPNMFAQTAGRAEGHRNHLSITTTL
jgi:hypothetical protein